MELHDHLLGFSGQRIADFEPPIEQGQRNLDREQGRVGDKARLRGLTRHGRDMKPEARRLGVLARRAGCLLDIVPPSGLGVKLKNSFYQDETVLVEAISLMTYRINRSRGASSPLLSGLF